ncbi:unnamed protein product [Acanthoscelides obtectus]|nr:unnamed protein product [Acanthoscelides obtectus]CAK1647065.1 DNA-dependent protein kinase catalytic subunit [Acanthoscelides obtectus]
MLKSFHHLPYQHHMLVVEAVCTTLLFLKNGKYFETYLENIVYQGVVWSCSHQHISMEAFAKETNEKIITCKNYFPLWRGVLKITEHNFPGLNNTLEDKKYIEERVVNELIKTLMILINKLNIKMYIKEDYGRNSSLENVYSVEHSNDYTIFLNVVDLYQDIFEISRPHLFRKCISRMVGDLIKKCLQYPLVSGFYRLLSFALKIGIKLDVTSVDYTVSLYQFLPTLLNRITQFKDELSISCLQVLLAIPISIIQEMLVACVDPFKTIFDIGKSYLPLADMGLTTLEYWQDHIDAKKLHPLLVEVVPSLDSFLRSKSVEENVQTVATKRRKTTQTLMKRRVVVVLEPELIKLQKKLLCFIGRQNLEVSRALVFSDNIYTSSEILGVNTHLKLALPCEDVQLDIIYDKFASRITDLALQCSDRKIRVMACECLHALIIVLLGRAKSLPEKSLPDLNAILKLFVSSALQLSCDVDQIVQHMFSPLCSQLIHWYTSRSQIRSAHSAVIVECLMDGVTHSSNAALRDKCGKYISEFVEWSIRQSNDSINVKVLVKKTRFFSAHPHPAKKLGAALIFNNIFKEILKEESLISMFWIEMLHIFVTSLATCEDFDETNTIIQTKKALQNLLNIFLGNPNVFNEGAKHRVVPAEMGTGTLPEIATWLFKETNCKNIHCRQMCMTLYVSVAPLAGDNKAHLNKLVDSLNGDLCNLYEYRFMSFSETNQSEDCTVLIKWMKLFLCTLDGYYFVIKNRLGKISLQNRLFTEVQYYMKYLQNIDISKALKLIAQKDWMDTAIDKENFSRLKGYCTLTMLKLFKEISKEDSLYCESEHLWNEYFMEFLKNNIFFPQLLGINQMNQEEHRNNVIELLNQISSRTETAMKLADVITTYIKTNSDTTIDIKENVGLKKRSILKGSILLKETSLSQKGFIKTELLLVDVIDKLMNSMYAEVKNGVIFLNELKDTVYAYCSSLFEFALKNREEFVNFVKHLYKPYLVQSIDYAKELNFCLYCLQRFAECTIPAILDNFLLFLDTCIEENNISITVEQLIFIFKHIQKDRKLKHHGRAVVSSIGAKSFAFISYFKVYENIDLGLEFIKNMLLLYPEVDIVFTYWIIDLTKSGDRTMEAFDVLIQVLKDQSELSGMDTLYTNLKYRFLSQSLQAEGYIDFNRILLLLPSVKSSMLLRFFLEGFMQTNVAVEMAQLVSGVAKNITEELQFDFMTQIYTMCRDSSFSFERRYRLAKEVIPPFFGNVSLSVFKRFHIGIIPELIKMLDGSNVEQKIITFIIIEVMVTRMTIDERVDVVIKDCHVTDVLKKITKYALGVFNEMTNSEALRLLRCHAYNATASLISNIDALKKIEFYEKCFLRQRGSNDILWSGIIDVTKTFNFPVLFDSIPTRRTILVSIRSRKQEDCPNSLQYIESQRLFNSSLVEDVSNFDFSNALLRSNKEPASETSQRQKVVTLDAVDINNHECMAVIIGLIQDMYDSGINELPREDDTVVLPRWMDGIRWTLVNKETHKNVKMFLVKVIDNMIHIFDYYPKWFLLPLMQFIVDECAGSNINYFVADVLVIISKWASDLRDLHEEDQAVASQLVKFVTSNINTEREDIMKYHLDILKLLVESWRNFTEVPTDVISKLFYDDNTCVTGIQIATVMLANGLEPWCGNEEERFFEALLKKFSCSKLLRLYSEAIGLFLHFMKNRDDYIQKVCNKLSEIIRNNPKSDDYYACLEGIAVHFPLILDADHCTRLINKLNQVSIARRASNLKIIHKRLEKSLDLLYEINDFKIITWHQLLEEPNLEIQIVTFEIIKKCIELFSSYDLFDAVMMTLLKSTNNSNALYRSCIYDVAILLYGLKNKYFDQSKEILVRALVDSDVNNREKVLKFWEDNEDIPKNVINRFSFLLLEMYKPEIEQQFLGILTHLLLSSLTSNESYDAPLFKDPLEHCDFEDYKLRTNWRLQHRSVVPMFAETLQTVYENSMDQDMDMLKKTQGHTFTQSIQEQQLQELVSLESSLSFSEGRIKDPNRLNLSQKYRHKRRFLQDKEKISRWHAHHETQKKIENMKKMIDDAKEREKKVTIYRKYRKGDFPDIQIKVSSMLKPLQMLVMNDTEVANIMFSDIFKGLLNKVKDNHEFLSSVSKAIEQIFQTSTHSNRHLFGVLLDIILLNTSSIRLESSVVTLASQQCGLPSVGALILEKYLASVDTGPSGSKRRPGQMDVENMLWLKLAELYRDLEEWDTVQSIFIEKVDCGKVKMAIQLESESKFREAQDIYHQIIAESSEDWNDFYWESYLRCFAALGEWEKLPEAINLALEDENTWRGLWDDKRCQRKLLPWYVDAHLKKGLFSGNFDGEFLSNINEGLTDPEKNDHLKIRYCEELCIMWLMKRDIPTAKIYLENYYQHFLEEWQHMNPIFQLPRYMKLLNLRNIVESGEFMNLYNDVSDAVEETLEKFITRLQRSTERLPTMVLNENRFLYESLYLQILNEKIQTLQELDKSKWSRSIQELKMNMRFDLILSAISFNMYFVARKYFTDYGNKLPNVSKTSILFGDILYLKGNLTTGDKKISSFLEAKGSYERCLQTHDNFTKLSVASKLFEVCSSISNELSSNVELFTRHLETLNIKFKTSFEKPQDVLLYGFQCLKSVVEKVDIVSDSVDVDKYEKCVAKAYMVLAYYARENTSREKELIQFVLEAMKLNSVEARQFFPCILMIDALGAVYRDDFVNLAKEIPTWMFLGWIPQILANMDSSKIFALSDIIIRIAETYPQAIIYPYRLSRETNIVENDGLETDKRIYVKSRLDELLLKNEVVNCFLKALSYVCLPIMVLRYYIGKIKKATSIEDIKSIQNTVIEEVFNKEHDSTPSNLQGEVYRKIEQYRPHFEKLTDETLPKIKDSFQRLDQTLIGVIRDNNPLRLKEFSPWLAEFSGERLNVEFEIPGQYDGQSKPLPQYHVKISGFSPEITIMKSVKKPIRLTILGMDTKEYPFLIKFGEDIRQDQRIEQLFGLMNHIFSVDITCSSRRFEIMTYQVIPLTTSLGMIQWKSNTESLDAFMAKSAQRTFQNDVQKSKNDYHEWIVRRNRNVSDAYGKAAKEYPADKVVPKFRELVNRFPKYVLRQALWNLSINTENFIALRNNFIKSYATICICHWILGIGDRHLGNSKICLSSGKVLGIDFGLAFGTATQIQAIPELVPMRLTPRIISIMEPFGERGQFKAYMIHCLRALRDNYRILLATMNVFIQEPSVDWLEHSCSFDDGNVAQEATWFPQVKIEQARRKLLGEASTRITIEEIEANSALKYKEAYINLVKSVRTVANVEEKNHLTVEEQIDCLLDQSTDYNLLGRMWTGWTPWI